ncbi:MAG: nucleotidyltransferase family protein [Ferruginibacter sp.]
MQIKECIILAGGLGTRLRSEVPDLPKCLAPVAGKPFLHWVIRHLLSQKVETFIFSVGYMHEKTEAFIAKEYPGLPVKFSAETTPLGTGGAIKFAFRQCSGSDVMAVNGDTLFETDHDRLMYYHLENNAACTLALKPVTDSDRYGSVETDERGNIISFREKTFIRAGLINGGVYLLNRQRFEDAGLPEIFSFEKDYLEKSVGAQKMIGVRDDGYFIDIGIPADLEKANIEIKQKFNASAE